MDSRRWDERYAGTDLLWSAEPNRFLVAEVAHLAPGRALDVACGEGRNAVWLARRGWDVVGVDFSPVAIAKARRLATHHGVEVSWVTADLTCDDLPAGPFDLVAVLYLHLPAPEMAGVLARAAALVGERGTFLVVAHDETNIVDGHGGPQDPAVLYGPGDVVRAIGQGFAVERAERVRRPVETSGVTAEAVDCLVRARRTTRRG
ncbi:MAG TPA: class I SAM-dependent methyltransferase [Acidimicrobiales bacterium]